MKNYLLGGLAALALSALPANAALVSIGGQDWTTDGAAILTLTPVVPGGNQPTNLPCIICGANQPQQPADLGYNLFGNQGNLTTLPYFSTSVVGGSLNPDAWGGVLSGYMVNVGSPLLNYLGNNPSFSIGIDSNQAGTNSQILESFWFLNFTTKTVLGVFSPEPGGTPIDPPNNGTGFPDYTLTGLLLTQALINSGDRIGFFARITNANDGPDSFFLQAGPAISEVPLPGAAWLFISGMAGLGLLAKRGKKKAAERAALELKAA